MTTQRAIVDQTMGFSAVLIADAHNQERLCAELQRIDISVPSRANGRTKEHREIWSICRLLASLAEARQLSYPISLHHDDKPDAIVRLGHAKIGVEITEAIPKNYAAYSALAEREFPKAIQDFGLFRPGSSPLSTDEMRRSLRTNRLTSPCWQGNSVEHEWAAYICSAVGKKLERLAQPDFRKYDQNWLSVYANLPLPSIDIEEAVGILRPLLQDFWRSNPRFHALYVEEGQFIICVTANGWEQIVLNDLWHSRKKPRSRSRSLR